MGSFQIDGKNAAALFTLRVHRGEGMALLAMNWKGGEPSDDFVGFAIEYKEPDGDRFFQLKNRINFPTASGEVAVALEDLLAATSGSPRLLLFSRSILRGRSPQSLPTRSPSGSRPCL